VFDRLPWRGADMGWDLSISVWVANSDPAERLGRRGRRTHSTCIMNGPLSSVGFIVTLGWLRWLRRGCSSGAEAVSVVTEAQILERVRRHQIPMNNKRSVNAPAARLFWAAKRPVRMLPRWCNRRMWRWGEREGRR